MGALVCCVDLRSSIYRILSAHGQLGTKVVISRTNLLGGGVLIATDSCAGADAEVTDSSNTEVKVVASRFGGTLSISGDSVNVEGDLGCHLERLVTLSTKRCFPVVVPSARR